MKKLLAICLMTAVFTWAVMAAHGWQSGQKFDPANAPDVTNGYPVPVGTRDGTPGPTPAATETYVWPTTTATKPAVSGHRNAPAAQVGNDWRVDMGGGELGVLTCTNGQLSVTVYSAEFISVACTGFKVVDER